jgi:hypothetical protein
MIKHSIFYMNKMYVTVETDGGRTLYLMAIPVCIKYS